MVCECELLFLHNIKCFAIAYVSLSWYNNKCRKKSSVAADDLIELWIFKMVIEALFKNHFHSNTKLKKCKSYFENLSFSTNY